jgi:hypothetical protein
VAIHSEGKYVEFYSDIAAMVSLRRKSAVPSTRILQPRVCIAARVTGTRCNEALCLPSLGLTASHSQLKSQDLVLPAFVEYMYTEYRASAAIPAAIVCRVSATVLRRSTRAVALHCTNTLRGRTQRTPLTTPSQALVLATPDVLAAYPYLSDVSAMSQPPSLSEIQTIALLRQGQDPHSAATVPARSKGKGRNSANGYFRPRHWEAYERELRGRNAEVWASILLRDRR